MVSKFPLRLNELSRNDAMNLPRVVAQPQRAVRIHAERDAFDGPLRCTGE